MKPNLTKKTSRKRELQVWLQKVLDDYVYIWTKTMSENMKERKKNVEKKNHDKLLFTFDNNIIKYGKYERKLTKKQVKLYLSCICLRLVCRKLST